MKKRFTDTDKWKKKWYGDLTPANKLFWVYLLDNCDHAGISDVDFALAEFQIGIELDEDEVNRIFGEKIAVLENGTKWCARDFPAFQYVRLQPGNKCHESVTKILSKHHLLGGDGQPLPSPLLTHKDKDQDKTKAKALVTDEAIEKAGDNSVDPNSLKRRDAFGSEGLGGEWNERNK